MTTSATLASDIASSARVPPDIAGNAGAIANPIVVVPLHVRSVSTWLAEDATVPVGVTTSTR